jgi:hypothetical protein
MTVYQNRRSSQISKHLEKSTVGPSQIEIWGLPYIRLVWPLFERCSQKIENFFRQIGGWSSSGNVKRTHFQDVGGPGRPPWDLTVPDDGDSSQSKVYFTILAYVHVPYLVRSIPGSSAMRLHPPALLPVDGFMRIPDANLNSGWESYLSSFVEALRCWYLLEAVAKIRCNGMQDALNLNFTVHKWEAALARTVPQAQLPSLPWKWWHNMEIYRTQWHEYA